MLRTDKPAIHNFVKTFEVKFDPYGEEESEEVEENKQDIYKDIKKVNQGIEQCVREGPRTLNY